MKKQSSIIATATAHSRAGKGMMVMSWLVCDRSQSAGKLVKPVYTRSRQWHESV
ncbi:hypothetical protein ACFSSA_03480 [Luteolibacter algae]|uniref:Uncharacterized protein n=1 Tax=Luteolibacter algae TaxID=454151 RepID=A0ABW5D3T4_9BACT